MKRFRLHPADACHFAVLMLPLPANVFSVLNVGSHSVRKSPCSRSVGAARTSRASAVYLLGGVAL